MFTQSDCGKLQQSMKVANLTKTEAKKEIM